MQFFKGMAEGGKNGGEVFGNLADPAVHTVQRRRNAALPGLPRFGCAVSRRYSSKVDRALGAHFSLMRPGFARPMKSLPVRPRR